MQRTLATLAAFTFLVFAVPHAQAACQTVTLQNMLGAFEGELCLDGSTLTLEGTAMQATTGAEYTVEGTATISRSSGMYAVTGTVTISDGTETRTYTFSTGGRTPAMAMRSFSNRSIRLALAAQPFIPRCLPAVNPQPSPEV